jgi:hypothetical protein
MSMMGRTITQAKADPGLAPLARGSAGIAAERVGPRAI